MAYTKRTTRKTYNKKKAPYKKAYKKTARATPSFAAAVKKVFLKNTETKKGVVLNPLTTKTTLIENGEILYLDNSPLYTTQGTADPQNTRSGNRIGDEVIPVGLSIKFMVGMHYQQSQVRFRWMLIRHTPGDLPVDDTLFQFSSMDVNKQLCAVDTERFTIIAQKTFTIYANNKGSGTSTYTGTQILDGGVIPTGTVYANPEVDPLGQAMKMCSVWIPGSKFGKKLRYQNGLASPKSWSYTSLIIPYSNMYAGVQGLLQGGAKVARMDDYISQFYFKDA